MKKEDKLRKSKMYELVDQWQTSGITQREFSRKEGITYERFKYWLKKYRKERGISKPSHSTETRQHTESFIPLQLNDSVGLTPTNIEIIYPNGVLIKCAASIDLNQLKQLIQIY